MIKNIIKYSLLFLVFLQISEDVAIAEIDYDTCVNEVTREGVVNAEQLRAILTDEKKKARFVRLLAKATHPDKCSLTKKGECNDKFIVLQDCLEVLSHPPRMKPQAARPNPSEQAQVRSGVAPCDAQSKSSCRQMGCIWLWDICAKSVRVDIHDPDVTFQAASDVSACLREGGTWLRGDLCVRDAKEKRAECESQNSFWSSSIWDQVNGCLNANLHPCFFATSERTCKGFLPGTCVWDASGNRCLSTFSSLCFFAGTQSSCNGIYGCVWDTPSEYCLSKLFNKCGHARDADSCRLFKCEWDKKSSECRDIRRLPRRFA